MKLNEQQVYDYENLYHCNNEGTGQIIAYQNFYNSAGQFDGYYGTLLDYCESFPEAAWAENEWGANFTAHYCESFNEYGNSVPGNNNTMQGDGGNSCACLEMEASIQNGVTPNPTFNDMTQFIAYCENGGPTVEPEEEEITVEPDFSCNYPFGTYSPETQNNLCNTFYDGQGDISDATWNNLLNNVIGPNGECCGQGTSSTGDYGTIHCMQSDSIAGCATLSATGPGSLENYLEMNPGTVSTGTYDDMASCQAACFDGGSDTVSPVEMCYKFNGLTEPQQGKFCTRCEQDEPTLDPIYGPNQDQYWLGGPYGELTASDCKCCDKPSPIKPKKGGPIKLKESIVKRFQKLANIKK